ncbi:capsid staple protein [Burkholderia gladioli]|uniref:capsid staple protein n=1 Tax=Burkholderia gladioli TaxID=28095 RepID=UPI0020B251B8|nr:hypothetical protein [Burkholderia gladioli]
MKLTPAEAKQESGAVPMDADQPAYPYGLTICLDDESLAKLGITTLPDVGTAFTLAARVEVCSTSQYQNQDGADRNLSLQITDMELSAPPSNQTPEQAAAKLYGAAGGQTT